MSGLINVADVINDPLFSQSFQIERFAGVFSMEGQYNRGSPVLLNGYGSIQPANQNDLQVLPEGERDGKFLKCYSLNEVRKGDGVALESDQIVWQNRHYRVMYTKLYNDYGYWFVIAQEVE